MKTAKKHLPVVRQLLRTGYVWIRKLDDGSNLYQRLPNQRARLLRSPSFVAVETAIVFSDGTVEKYDN